MRPRIPPDADDAPPSSPLRPSDFLAAAHIPCMSNLAARRWLGKDGLGEEGEAHSSETGETRVAAHAPRWHSVDAPPLRTPASVRFHAAVYIPIMSNPAARRMLGKDGLGEEGEAHSSETGEPRVAAPCTQMALG